MGLREQELAELYALARQRPLDLQMGLSEPRLRELLAKYTPFAGMGPFYKKTIANALALGATLDSSGKLVINDPKVRTAIINTDVARCLVAKMNALVSPETQNVKKLFMSVRLAKGTHLGPKRKGGWRGSTGLSPLGEKKRFGVWPAKRPRIN